MSEVTLNPLKCALDEAQALRGQVDALQAENVQLQELLVEVLHELDKVEENVSHGWFWEAARELGVEVDA